MCAGHTNRGGGGQIALLEEAAYINPNLVFQVVLPTLSTGCSLICISTVSSDESNFLAKLVAARDARGNPVIFTLDLKMVCDRCIRAGAELSCKHMLGQLPAWQQRGRHDTIQRLMGTNEDVFLTEVRGLVTDAKKTPAFDPTAMTNLMENPDRIWTPDGSDIRHIFVGLDPAAGGSQSEYAVVSAFYGKNDEMVICGAEAGAYREQRSCAGLLINHIMSIKKNVPGAANARIVFIPESNLAFESLWITDAMARCGLGEDWRVMFEDSNRAGVKTSRELKHLMVLNLNAKLVLGRVYTMSHFVSIGDSERTPEDMREHLLKQMAHYSRKVKPPRDKDHGSPTVSYSGKDGIGFDDLCIAVQLLDLMRNRFWADPDGKYKAFH